MSAFSYICTAGHVDLAPTMGTYASCQWLVEVAVGGRVRGHAPCGCAVVRVPADPVLEAAFKLGGKDAVKSLLAERVGDRATPPVQAGQRF